MNFHRNRGSFSEDLQGDIGKFCFDKIIKLIKSDLPILIQVFFNSGLAYWLNRRVGEQHSVACPSALIGASNFFELAVAAAISLFGFESGAALATVVGVLVEVPVMLSLVAFANRTRNWFPPPENDSAG